MTKEEAIEMFEDIIGAMNNQIANVPKLGREAVLWIADANKSIEAYKLAIKALEEMKDNAEN